MNNDKLLASNKKFWDWFNKVTKEQLVKKIADKKSEEELNNFINIISNNEFNIETIPDTFIIYKTVAADKDFIPKIRILRHIGGKDEVFVGKEEYNSDTIDKNLPNILNLLNKKLQKDIEAIKAKRNAIGPSLLQMNLLKELGGK